ncbi:hypothetical protein SEA_JKSYNGBOY_67 [Gordonia phage JKSyngboy]|uniref:Uncharacterized protein n=1 Tax=Gordonia phage JKSyngboy TaxID=2762400 RepID=A0A7G8LLB9_9CAUD|nr:hypothetical protein J1762_gp67 [Gordonia phage JKSyngboy]QNJ58041.1 hypothetical protein SEA_JKSYNGBOY_67 [Gordonia phage JKSyngboy]
MTDDPARKTADAIAARLTDTIIARYQGDQPHMTKQADPNGRTPFSPPTPPNLADVKPQLHVQAMLETARAEGRADALAEQLSDLSLDRMALVDRLVDREREAANVIVGLIEDRAKAVAEAANTRALLDSATAKVAELQADVDADPRREYLQSINDVVTDAITTIGGSNLTDSDTTGDRVDLLAERAIELHQRAGTDVDDERRLTRIVDEARDLAADTLVEHHLDVNGADAPPAAIPDGLVDLVGALRSTLRYTRDRAQQLQAANDALQQTVNGRHTVVDGDVRSHAEPAPMGNLVSTVVADLQAAAIASEPNGASGGFDVGAPYEQTVEAAPLPADVTQAIDVAKDAAATGGESPATPCANCGHTRAAHDPGSYWNADQRAIHQSCKPPCPCSDYCDRRMSDG